MHIFFDHADTNDGVATGGVQLTSFANGPEATWRAWCAGCSGEEVFFREFGHLGLLKGWKRLKLVSRRKLALTKLFKDFKSADGKIGGVVAASGMR